VQVWKLGIGKGGTNDLREFLSHRQTSVPVGAKVLFTWAKDGGEDERGGDEAKEGPSTRITWLLGTEHKEGQRERARCSGCGIYNVGLGVSERSEGWWWGRGGEGGYIIEIYCCQILWGSQHSRWTKKLGLGGEKEDVRARALG